MPLEIKQFLQKNLPGAIGLLPTAELHLRPLGGGSINAAYQLSTNHNSRWFCKFNNTTTFPDLFVKEDRGLALLRRQHVIRVPATVACLQADGHQLLVLEWIEQGPRTDGFWRQGLPGHAGPKNSMSGKPSNVGPSASRFWRLFGEQLATLHRLTQPEFGLAEDNYMGALPQANTPSADWIDFFIHRRLEPQIHLAARQGLLDGAAIRHFERLYQRLPHLFPPEPPALLHGDLWNGNFLCDATGRPVLIDPAV
ncbi:MAG TPA: fructosamine kinase family protein [Puia sp.]|nr:fructosamine kinase family protein [Puia sp.]